jgi:redox-regulated HSP33 family molecular chaperone
MKEGFFCGVEPEGLICGRVLENKKTQGLCVVQRQGEKSPMAQSHVTLITQDPVEAVERYFEEAEQTLIRIAVDDAGRGVLLRPMPGGTFEAVNGLSDALIIERIFGLAAGGDMQHLEEVLLFYACPCSPEKIQAMITSLPADQSAQLWGDLKQLEIACPRCGRYYEVAR